MSLSRPTIVLFDMDGTTVRHVNPMLLGALECLDDVVYKVSHIFQKHQGLVTEPEPLPEKPPRLLVHRMLHRFRRKPVEQIVQPCPGIYSILNLLKENRVPLGIVSNGLGKGYGHDILEKFRLGAYFTAQIFREDIAKSKPHPDPIIRALDNIGRPVTQDDVIWYIGDRSKDMMAALAADEALPAKIVPFAYGIKAAVTILKKNIGPDHIIMNYQDFTLRTATLFRQAAQTDKTNKEEYYRAKSSAGS